MRCCNTLAKYGPGDFSGSDDPDFEAARAIMQTIHCQKIGVPFDIVAVHTIHGYDHPIYKDRAERNFMSHVNACGTYEQWGSERGEGLRVKNKIMEE